LNVLRTLFMAQRSLHDEQIPPERQQKALVRLKRYAGQEAGYTPVTKLAEELTRSYMKKPGLLLPPKIQVEKDLADQQFLTDGIGKLYEKYKVAGYEQAYAALKQQLADYEKFIRAEILPKARRDFRLPPEEYAFNLDQYGVDMPPTQLIQRAHSAFDDIQADMDTLATLVAQQNVLAVTDYRAVIRVQIQSKITCISFLS